MLFKYKDIDRKPRQKQNQLFCDCTVVYLASINVYGQQIITLRVWLKEDLERLHSFAFKRLKNKGKQTIIYKENNTKSYDLSWMFLV